MQCTTEGCEGRVEANMSFGLRLHDDGTWEAVYIGDDNATITCDDANHENFTPELNRSMVAYLDATFPGLTWNTSGGHHL